MWPFREIKELKEKITCLTQKVLEGVKEQEESVGYAQRQDDRQRNTIANQHKTIDSQSAEIFNLKTAAAAAAVDKKNLRYLYDTEKKGLTEVVKDREAEIRAKDTTIGELKIQLRAALKNDARAKDGKYKKGEEG